MRNSNGTFKKGSKINSGRVPSEEQKEKQAKAMKGRILSEEHKEKIRLGMLNSKKNIGHKKGNTAWNKGLRKERGELPNFGGPCSDRTKRKISEANTGFKHSEDTKKKLAKISTGKTQSKHARERISAGQKKRWSDPKKREELSKRMMGNIPWNKDKKDCFTEEAIRNMLRRRTPSSLEEKFMGIVEKNNLPYKFVGDGSFMIGKKNPDFININGAKIAIEVYARFYKLKHAETIEEWKEDREKIFSEYGWDVLFFDETQVNERNVLKQLR